MLKLILSLICPMPRNRQDGNEDKSSPWSGRTHMHFTIQIAHCHFPKSRTFALQDIFQPLNLIGRCHFLQSRYIFSRNILHIDQFSLFPRSSTIFVKYLMASNLPSGVIVQLSFIRILLITYLVERTKMISRHGRCTTSSACFKQIAWNAEYYHYYGYWLLWDLDFCLYKRQTDYYTVDGIDHYIIF